MHSVFSRLERLAKERPHSLAYVAQDGQEVSFATLWELVRAFAERLVLEGVTPGDYVVTSVNHYGVTLMIRLAIAFVGGTVVLSSDRGSLSHRAVPVKFRIVEGAGSNPSKGIILFDRSWFSKPSTNMPPQPDFSVLTSSSGSTGIPKFMEITGEGFAHRVLRQEKDRPVLHGPAFVAYGVSSGVGFAHPLRLLLAGNTLISPLPDPVKSLERMRAYGVRYILVPAQYLPDLVEAAEQSGIRLPDLRYLWAGGGAVSRSYAERAEQLLDCAVFNTYGASECDSVSHGRPTLYDIELGLVGKPLERLEIAFLRDDGSAASPGEGGEISVYVPPIFRISKCYGAPMPYDDQGRLRTGDTGYLREDGNLVITGRVKNIINAGGNKIAPSSIETLALQFPDVREAVAFGVQNALGSEDAALAITVAKPIDLKAFNRHMDRKFAQRIKIWPFILEDIPVMPNQKLDMEGIRKLFPQKTPL